MLKKYQEYGPNNLNKQADCEEYCYDDDVGKLNWIIGLLNFSLELHLQLA